MQATQTVPIVFAVVADPVGSGFVDSLARPGGGDVPANVEIEGAALLALSR